MEQKLKIKTESLPIRCEICHKSDLFDSELGHCYRCNEVPQIKPAQSAPLHTHSKSITHPPSVAQPVAPQNTNIKNYENFSKKVSVSVSSDYFQITFRWFNLYSLLYLIGFLILLCFCKDPISQKINGSILWFISSIVGYYLIGNCINRTEITVNGKTLKVTNGPLPFWFNRKISVVDINLINVKAIYHRKYDYLLHYSLEAQLFSGKTYALIEQINSLEDAYYMQQQLQEWINSCRWAIKMEQDRQYHSSRQNQKF